MIIKSIRLENFQSHKNSLLELHSGFNAIVGTGNSGKSSIVRALSFIFYGIWDNSWVRVGEKFCRITLTTDSDIVITREKGTAVNRYAIEEPGKKKQVYENFGVHIPAEVQQVLQIYKVQLDDNDFLNLNIAQQLDPLFLLSRPGSSKAKILGKLTGAHFLDHALREINKDKKNLSGEKNTKSSELLEAQKQLLEYKNLDAQKEEIENFSSKITEVESIQTKIDKLKNLFSRTATWKQKYSTACDEEEALSKFNIPAADDLGPRLQVVTQMKQLKFKLDQHKFKVDAVERESIALDQSLEKARKSYIEMLQQSKKCPTCQSPIDDARVHMLEENL